jgi:riboflavin kinase/FMN adenylyltransferase
VEPGAGRGKGLGFPTLNLELAPGQDPRHGIYAMRVAIDGRSHPAAGYIGSRPTFGGSDSVLEAYLLDFTGDLYGKEVEAELIAFLRPDQTFATREALSVQMRADCEAARAILAKLDADDPMRRFPLGRALAPAQDAI